MLIRIIKWAIVLFIVFFVATQPSGAAGVVHAAYDGMHDAVASLAAFVNSL
jgi:drug/metabolite transporter superfamily protein YnfA